MSLTADQILALAPDASSAKAGNQLAMLAKWDSLGSNAASLWGECKGSAKEPYRTQIDIGEPAFKCSCPSRKFPCKHGLALYLLFAGHATHFIEATPPQWVSDWLQERRQRAEKKQQASSEKAAAQTPEQAAASAAQGKKREEKRETKVAQGLNGLQTWLQDLAREGLSSVRGRGPAYWDGMAARLVDAQAGALATRLRRAGGLCFDTATPDWERQLGQELAALWLLGEAYFRLDQLPPGLQHDVRTAIGWNSAQDDVIGQAGLVDSWQVLAQQHGGDDKIRSRSTLLRGIASGRWAWVLHFAVGTQGFDKPLSAGTQFDGELVFYPGAWPLRALIKQQGDLRTVDASLPRLPSFDTALDSYADALAANPFLDRHPLALEHVTPENSVLCRSDDHAIPLRHGFAHYWQLLAVSGGHPVTLIGDWDGATLLPWSVWADGRLYNFESDFGA